MITSLALVSLLVLVWLALSLPLAILIGRCISVGQSTDAERTAPGRGRLTPAAVRTDRVRSTGPATAGAARADAA